MDDFVSSKEVVSPTPDDTQHPKMYENATYILGAVAGMCALAIALLAGLGHPVPSGLEAGLLTATGGLVALLTPRK